MTIADDPERPNGREAVKPSSGFSEVERDAVYRAMAKRRDVRRGYLEEPLDDETLGRILGSTEFAPSVGLAQPWRITIVEELSTRRSIAESFERANAVAKEQYRGDRRAKYDQLKLQGIVDAPIGLCVTAERDPAQGHGLGRQSMPETLRYSAVCAIANLWLAARVEGVGVGWVSVLDPDEVRRIIGFPDDQDFIAWLCVGYVTQFDPIPELESAGWERRGSLADHLYFNQFGRRDPGRAERLSGRVDS